MRSTSRRLAGIAAALLVTVTTWVVVQNQAGAVSPPAPPPPDSVVLNLGLGNGGSPSYWRWTPSGNTGFPTSFTQSITGGGGCADPNLGSPTPLVALSAQPAGAIATAYNGRMGVCYTNPNFGIDPGETLVFKIGTAGPMVGRYFSKVDLSLQQVNNQFPNNSTWTARADMFLKNTLVGTHTISHMGNTPFVETIQVSGGVVNFDELRLSTLAPVSGAAPSISVSGGTSKQPLNTTFWLNDLLCGGETITSDFSSGSSSLDAAATNTAAAGTVCKPYAAFSWAAGRPDSAVLPASGPAAHLVFDTTATANARVRITIDWGLVANCVPTPVAGGPPTCKVTYVNVTPNDPNAWAPQSFCASASVAQPWCTVEKHFTYVTDADGVTKTHITEVWEGFGDPQMW